MFQRTTQRSACRSGVEWSGERKKGMAIGTTVDMIVDNLLALDSARMVL